MGKQVSPLRYPGGKAKLYPYFTELIISNYKNPPCYCEPFAGGFGLGIALLLQDIVSEVILNDYDFCISAFWRCIVEDSLYEKMMKKIDQTEVTIAEWKKQKQIYLNYADYMIDEVGFATLFLNRCNRSGILEANPIGGTKQEGAYKLDCRFNKDNLKKTIASIHNKKERMRIYQEEAHVFIPKIDKEKDNMLINLDPPYYNAGPMLYKNNFTHEDHKSLSLIVKNLRNHWIMTYDDTEEIQNLYKGNIIRNYQLNYSLANKRKATELIIYDNRLKNPLLLV